MHHSKQWVTLCFCVTLVLLLGLHHMGTAYAQSNQALSSSASEQQPESQSSSDTATTPTPSQTPSPTLSSTPEPMAEAYHGMGMTWSATVRDEKLDLSSAQCADCDAYQGDTACTESLPILCLHQDGSPRPPYDVSSTSGGVMPPEFYNGWGHGWMGATSPIKGTLLTSPQAADNFCTAELGDGYRMIEHHDGKWIRGMNDTTYYSDTWPDQSQLSDGGWRVFAHGKVDEDTRYWAHVNGQPANCWNSALVTPTPTPTSTSTLPPTSTSIPTSTLTPTPTSTLTPTPTSTLTPTPTSTQFSNKGMTWASKFIEEHKINYSGCHGQPPTESGSCNAYQGDTMCTEALPILCLLQDDSPRPAYDPAPSAGSMPKEFYRGWANGRIASTLPVIGTALTSAQVANDICAQQLGSGYRMAEHHDGLWKAGMDSSTYAEDTWPDRSELNVGGWNFFSNGQVSNATRYWVHVNGQPANCWNSAPQQTLQVDDAVRGAVEITVEEDRTESMINLPIIWNK